VPWAFRETEAIGLRRDAAIALYCVSENQCRQADQREAGKQGFSVRATRHYLPEYQ